MSSSRRRAVSSRVSAAFELQSVLPLVSDGCLAVIVALTAALQLLTLPSVPVC